MQDLVTVTATNDPSIQSQIVIAPVVELDVFADLCAGSSEWKLAAFCIWMPTPPTWHCLLEYADPRLRHTAVFPYACPYFQLRRMISTSSNPNFYVEFIDQTGKKRRFSKKDGRPHHQCDALLSVVPPYWQMMLHVFRPLPANTDELLRMHS